MGALRLSAAPPRSCHLQPSPPAQPWITLHEAPRHLQPAHCQPDSQASLEPAPSLPSTHSATMVHTITPALPPSPAPSTLVAGHTWLWAAAVLAAVRVARRDLDADSYFERRRKVCGLYCVV